MNLLSIPATIDVSTNFVICHNFISCLVMKVPHILVLCYLISLPSSGINHKKVYFNQFCDLFTTTSVNNLINELAIFILSKKKLFSMLFNILVTDMVFQAQKISFACENIS